MGRYGSIAGRRAMGAAAGLLLATVAGQGAPAAASRVGLEDFLWREVQNREGETLGSVSDVLVQMPSGRIVFVAVVPSAFFERPKAVPPGTFFVPAKTEAPLQVDISTERWIEAPRIDWDGALIVKNTEDGRRIYGYYQQAWQDPDPSGSWGMVVVASPADAPPVRYVSLKKLLLNRVVTVENQQAGYVQDFLLDWGQRRATHALVSPRFTPFAKPDEQWFAVPTPLLNPPVEHDAMGVNAGADLLRQAQTLPTVDSIPPHQKTEIYLVSVGLEPTGR